MVYQQEDPWMDYGETLYHNQLIRGSVPSDLSHAVCFIGAAQTYGRFCDRPFPQLVCDSLGMQCFNLGVSGAGPEEPLFHNPYVLLDINQCKLVVIQIMSGRSVSNWKFRIDRGQAGWTLDNKYMYGEQFWKKMWESGDQRDIELTLKSTIDNYVLAYSRMCHRMYPPIILLNISNEQRKNSYSVEKSSSMEDSYKNYIEFLGPYPHFIEKIHTDCIKNDLECELIEYCGRVGLPQQLPQPRNTDYYKILGNNVDPSINNYYPSPEMHVEIAELIIEELGIPK